MTEFEKYLRAFRFPDGLDPGVKDLINAFNEGNHEKMYLAISMLINCKEIFDSVDFINEIAKELIASEKRRLEIEDLNSKLDCMIMQKELRDEFYE